MKNCCDWSREVARKCVERIVKVERKKKKNEKKEKD